MALALNYVMRIDIDLGSPLDIGQVPDGYRRMLPIIGGRFNGERLCGTVVAQGADWNMVQQDEIMAVRTEYLLKTADDVLIGIINEGMVRDAVGQSDLSLARGEVHSGTPYTRMACRYDAPAGKYDWLNRSIFVAVLLPPEGVTKVSMEVYEFA